MNASEKQQLAEKLRDQAFADLLFAHVNLGQRRERLGTLETSRNHIVISKCQQSAEKLLKSYFVWHAESVNPYRGHTPMNDVITGTGGTTARLQKFRESIRKIPGLLRQIGWLEGLAPAGPPAGVSDLSTLDMREVTPNTEYPFFSAARGEFVCPAEHFEDKQGLMAIRASYALFKFIAETDDTSFGKIVGEFINERRLVI